MYPQIEQVVSDKLPESTEVAIIGGGIIGVSKIGRASCRERV